MNFLVEQFLQCLQLNDISIFLYLYFSFDAKRYVCIVPMR